MVALVIENLLGYLTITASVMAFGKLQETRAHPAHDVQRPELRQPDAARHRRRDWRSG